MKIKYYLRLFVILMGEYFQQSFKEITSNIWTFVGLFSTWIVLTGTAKTVIQNVIMYAFILWILTVGFRLPHEDKQVIMLKREAHKMRASRQGADHLEGADHVATTESLVVSESGPVPPEAPAHE
jgi:hypothetical protein